MKLYIEVMTTSGPPDEGWPQPPIKLGNFGVWALHATTSQARQSIKLNAPPARSAVLEIDTDLLFPETKPAGVAVRVVPLDEEGS